MKTGIVALLLSLLVLGYFLVRLEPDEDHAQLQGKWAIESVTQDGSAVGGLGEEMEFAENQLTVSTLDGTDLLVSYFNLDPTSKPKILALDRGHREPGSFFGNCAYELSGDGLKVVSTSPDKRPTEISDKGQVLMTLKRKKR